MSGRPATQPHDKDPLTLLCRVMERCDRDLADDSACWRWTHEFQPRKAQPRMLVKTPEGWKHRNPRRLAYAAYYGVEPKETQTVLSTCATGEACCNPRHMQLAPRGEEFRQRYAKVTPAQVVAIRAASEGTTRLMQQYNLSKSQVLRIVKGLRWRWVQHD